jgi:molecular chaperone GrpE
VLDDVRSAREHEELNGGFKAVAEEIERVTSKYGLESFGEPGDPFNPHIHEALLHAHATGIDGPTCVEILQPGYRIGDRILRPARVAVAEPEPDAPAAVAEPVEAAQHGSPEPVEAAQHGSPEPVEGPASGQAAEPADPAGESGRDESAANDHQP